LYWFESKAGGYPEEWINNMSWEQYKKLSAFFSLKYEREKAEMEKQKKKR